MKLTLGFSPCPNDTFIFDALVNGGMDTRGFEFDYVMEDVETLNRWAAEGKLDITKLSYNSFLHTADQYALLHAGSALGKGVGPLLVTTPQNARDWQTKDWISGARIAIPGINTTANLLLSLAFPQAKQKTEVVFSDIEKKVLDGAFDAGLIIHESRFTYQQKGLVKLADLGDWWENTMNAAIPLGGIVIRRSLGAEIAATVDALIKESIGISRSHYPRLSDFVQCHAQEMDETVMRQHIDLYVNEFTDDLGATGTHAVLQLFTAAFDAGLISQPHTNNIFY